MQKFDKHLKFIWEFSVGIALLLTLVLLFFPKKQAPTEQIVIPKSHAKITTIFLAGDIMLSRDVAGKMIKANDFTLPFQKTAEVTNSADIAFANLEAPFLDQPPYAQNDIKFKVDPKAVAGLKFAGFDILSTANNHALDQGQKGVFYTLAWLALNQIKPIGTGPDCHIGQVLERNGIKFGFLAYSYAAFNDGGKKPDPAVCDANDTTQVSSDIHALKPKVDFLIVSMHMGIEYTRTPTIAQENFAHNAVDSGADLVVGAHPHWIQPPEQYQGKWIFYSLGNFVFDQMWSRETREGLTIKLSLADKKLSKIELMPVIIDDYCCARFANPDESAAILSKVGLTNSILLDNN
ncbi:MAG: CapA family protein [Candidatus Doudnabacteria bacterium]